MTITDLTFTLHYKLTPTHHTTIYILTASRGLYIIHLVYASSADVTPLSPRQRKGTPNIVSTHSSAGLESTGLALYVCGVGTLLVIQFANCLTCILNHPALPEAKILQADQIIWK